MIPALQLESLAVTSVVLALSAVLALVLFRSYLRKRRGSTLFWSLGMIAFSAGVLMEVLFALDVHPLALVDAYLFDAALLVELLALGSMQLVSSRRKRLAYYVFCVVTTAFLAYSLLAYGGVNIVESYVAAGEPSLQAILASSAITFPASVLLVAVALFTYSKTRNPRMLATVAGVAVVVVCGTLYIAAFPAFLYVSEFIGIVLLWFSFYSGRKG